jgi:hypothetical protein
VSVKRSGTTSHNYLPALARSMEDFHGRLLEAIKEATLKAFSNTGYLANNITGERTARGGHYLAPAGRLEAQTLVDKWSDAIRPFLAGFLHGVR